MRIAMWSGPRNLSTALMYSFAARGDCAVLDEPFYAPYLAESGQNHPMTAQIIAAHPIDPVAVAHRCEASFPQGCSLFYQKHMPHHMLPGFPLDWMAACQNVFLIRHPSRVIASYARKREGPSLQDLGYVQQAELFDREAERLGHAPIVVDSHDIRADPRGALMRLCAALGISFSDRMLSWPKGGHAQDGVWAAHWYGAVHRSTGFEAAEGPLPGLDPAYSKVLEAALPFYERLAAQKI